ncbi:DEAD/DEAH box helicase [Lactobacillus amylovorus subsp. animalium]|uniref:DEAD/DEAH box helicase n=1 Tax=Lactobacillus amylovorus subsp. animalium TaxID=3378536 RepID=A0ABC9VK17_LACAM
MYELRSYQTDLINKVTRSMKTGHKHIVVQSPPRTGKTVVMAEIARKTTIKNNRVMFIVHRKEVLDQTITTFYKQNVDSNLLTAGMVQTLSRRINILPTPQLILIDEGHHALAKSYQKILNKFPDAYVLFFTATPIRTGRKQLDLIADDLIVGKSIRELTKEKFLAPFKYYSVPYDDLNTNKLKRSSTGDYTKKSMNDALSNKIYGHVIENYLKIAKDKQAVVYTYSINSAKKLAQQFNQSHINAVELDGTSNKDFRDKTVKAFKNQQLKILVNVDLFTEGVDLPNVDCVIMVRPTESLSLYMQFSMRCLNPRPGKTAIIIDHVKNYQKFGLPNADRNWKQVFHTKAKNKHKSNVDGGPNIVTCPSCFAVVDREEIEDNTCPICQFKPIVQTKGKKIVDQELTEIDQKEIERKREAKKRQKLINSIIHDNVVKNVVNKRIGQLRTYQEFKAYAEIHGYTNKWAYVMFNKMIKGRNV